MFSDPLLDVMNVLNEAALDYPRAISFAAGRPPDDLFQVRQGASAVSDFLQAQSAAQVDDQAWNALGRYNRTNGIINDVLAAHLAIDQDIHVAPEHLIVTVGAQEAMAIVLIGLFEPATDILLVTDPTYIGITGLARLFGIRVWPVPSGDGGLEAATLEREIDRARGRVRVIYDIPDFNNPMGTRVPLAERMAILEVCRRRDILVIEDNADGMFAHDDNPLPALKALDDAATVLYVGSFAKTLFPSLRIGYLVADQGVAGTNRRLATELSRVKSFTTVNTSALLQGMAAGVLLRGGRSLRDAAAPKRARLKANRDVLLAALAARFAEHGNVRWNRPEGGFFLTVSLPFEFGPRELRDCAADYGVIVCPMQCFSIGARFANRVRLAFGSVSPDDIREGVERFATYIESRAADVD